MSGLHLNHKVSWSHLVPIHTIFNDSGIELPVGPCGLIHIVDKKTQLQLENRKYLTGKVCHSNNCKVSGTDIFKKNNKKKYSLSKCWTFSAVPRSDKDTQQALYFVNSFDQAIVEFANTELKKIGRRIINNNPDRRAFYNEVVEVLEKKHSNLPSIKSMKESYLWDYHSLCALFPVLIEADEISLLLSFNDSEIGSVLSCLHGGQAVGNNWMFLYDHVFEVYMYTNLIVACGLENKPDEWGKMKPQTYFRSFLMHDCDGQTFLHSSRKYLENDVYMKDFDAMKELCRNCFKFIYVTDVMANAVGVKWRRPWSYWQERVNS